MRVASVTVYHIEMQELQEENPAAKRWGSRGCRGAEASVSLSGNTLAAPTRSPGRNLPVCSVISIRAISFSLWSGSIRPDVSSVRLQAAAKRNVFHSSAWQRAGRTTGLYSQSQATLREDTPRNTVRSLQKWKFRSLCKNTSEIGKHS